MATFAKSVLIQAPVGTVFGFHERDDALQILSPPFPPLRVIKKTGGIESGSTLQLRIGPFWWTALHTGYVKNQFFVDEQIVGPFAKWIHRHEFEARGSATLLTDRVEFRLPGLEWAVQLALHQMFRYRHSTTKRYCEKRDSP